MSGGAMELLLDKQVYISLLDPGVATNMYALSRLIDRTLSRSGSVID